MSFPKDRAIERRQKEREGKGNAKFPQGQHSPGAPSGLAQHPEQETVKAIGQSKGHHGGNRGAKEAGRQPALREKAGAKTH